MATNNKSKASNFSMNIDDDEKKIISNILNILDIYKEHILTDPNMPDELKELLSQSDALNKRIPMASIIKTIVIGFYNGRDFKKYRLNYDKLSKTISEDFKA